MDYSLLVGIHDVDRAEQEEMEVEDRAEDEECENDGLGGNPISSYGTPPDSPGNLLNYPRFFGPGEFDPSVDVYAMKSHESEWSIALQAVWRAEEVCCGLAGLDGVGGLATQREGSWQVSFLYCAAPRGGWCELERVEGMCGEEQRVRRACGGPLVCCFQLFSALLQPPAASLSLLVAPKQICHVFPQEGGAAGLCSQLQVC